MATNYEKITRGEKIKRRGQNCFFFIAVTQRVLIQSVPAAELPNLFASRVSLVSVCTLRRPLACFLAVVSSLLFDLFPEGGKNKKEREKASRRFRACSVLLRWRDPRRGALLLLPARVLLFLRRVPCFSPGRMHLRV